MSETQCRQAMMTVIFEYNSDAPEFSTICTNMTDDAAKDLLRNWLRSKGVKPEDVASSLCFTDHRIKIQDNLQGEFFVESDTESELRLIELIAAACNHFGKWEKKPFNGEDQF